MDAARAFELKIREAIVYPAAIAVISFGASAAVLMAVGPMLSRLFAVAAVEPPLTTKIIIVLGGFFIQSWLAFVLAIFFPAIFLKTKKGKKIWDGLILKLPLVSPIIKKINIIGTIGRLSSLIAAGVPLAEALTTTSRAVKNYYYQEAVVSMAARVGRGDKLSIVLKDYPDLYPLMVSQTIEVGEETAKTPVILDKLSNFLKEDVLDDVKNLRKISDPLLMLVLGGFIGFLAVSVIQSLILF